jgi:hypothetical protein
LFCYRASAQYLDATRSQLAVTGFDLTAPKLDDNNWAKMARAAVGFCRSQGFGGGFMVGHEVPNKYGVVCQRP